MKRYFLIISLVLISLVGSADLASGMQTARIRPGQGALTYSAQRGNTQALNLGVDWGMSNTLGLNALFTYTPDGGTNYLDLNAKLKFIEDSELTVAGLIGLHGDFTDYGIDTQLGVVVTQRQSQFLDLNGALITLLGEDTSSLGIELGIQYELLSHTDLQLGYRRLVGQEDTEGISFGLRTSL